MRTKAIWACFCIALLTSAHLSASPPRPAAYSVHQALPLRNGYSARILRDVLADKADRERDPDDPLVLYIQNMNIRCANAVFQVLDPTGNSVFSQELERPLAGLEGFPGEPKAPALFWVDVDYTWVLGSYSGPIRFLGRLDNGAFAWVKAATCQGGSEAVRVMSSLKTGWEVTPSGDVLEKACRPDFGQKPGSRKKGADLDFNVIFRRYKNTSSGWKVFERRQPGFWENENGIGEENGFPAGCPPAR